jgi:epoxyqueuosine reductase
MHAPDDTAWIAERARAVGFDLCGIVRAEKFPELGHFPEWLERGFAGEMQYLHDARRQDPASVLSGARSVIVCALNYNPPHPASIHAPPENNDDNPRGWISRYAWGDDYHQVLGAKLERLTAALHEQFQETFEARWYVDTGPIHERVAAHHAGLGWLGKNTLLINEKLGSFLFLGVILTTLDLAPSQSGAETPPDLCGNCQLCVEACPTGAFIQPYMMDARRCISYLTIELRGPIPQELRAPMGRNVFGCDICQDVCPWNGRAPWTRVDAFEPRVTPPEIPPHEAAGLPAETLLRPRLERLAALSEDEFRHGFFASAIRRAKWPGLLRNACIALGNSAAGLGPAARRRIFALLEKLSASPDAGVSESARWALQRVAAVENPPQEPGIRETAV